MDDALDDWREAGGNGLRDEGSLLHQVAGYFNFASATCTVEKGIFTIRFNGVFPMDSTVDIELHLFHEIFDHTKLAC